MDSSSMPESSGLIKVVLDDINNSARIIRDNVESLRDLLGDQPPPPASKPKFVIDEPGVFHVPKSGWPSFQRGLDIPLGTYTCVTLSMSVKVTTIQPLPIARYEVFWLVLGGNDRQLGYLLFLPNHHNGVRLQHGDRVPWDEKHVSNLNVQIEPGQYDIRYAYNTDEQTVWLRMNNVSHKMNGVMYKVGTPNVEAIVHDDPRDKLIVHCSFNNPPTPNDGKESPSYDWEYSNLRVELS